MSVMNNWGVIFSSKGFRFIPVTLNYSSSVKNCNSNDKKIFNHRNGTVW